MNAVAVHLKDGAVREVDIPEPEIASDGDVLVRTLKVGLCGTDREILEHGYGRPPDGSDFLVLGHECLGEVMELGKGVTRLKPGQLVVPAVRRPCNSTRCAACRKGRPDFCLTGDFTERGIIGAHGYLCERFIDSQEYFFPVPDELREVGVLTEPLTVAMKALIQIRDVQDRLPYIDKASLKKGELEGLTGIVLGAGPVGLLGAMALLNAGARVYVFSRHPEPNPSAAIVEEAGGEYVSSQTVSTEQLMEMAGPADIIYEATGASQFAFEMTELLGRNGIYIMTGVPGRKGPVKINADKIMKDIVLKNQLLVGTVNAGAQAYEAAIQTLGEIYRRWPHAVKGIITNVVTPDQVQAALTGEKKGIKHVVKFP